ncbi:MAG: ABC transporter permease [Bacillota bacterium]|nr:ABC transporter permease [Bacillota bacterium]
MTNKLIWKLSLQSMRSRKQILFPYLLASILLFAMEFVMISLIENDYIQTRHETLPTMMSIAAFISMIFTIIFVLYANRFAFKNKYKELGLFSVLGMEKKHLNRMTSCETILNYLIVCPFSICLGYLFGILSFTFINRLMRDSGASMMEYPFSNKAMLLSIILISFCHLLTALLSRRSIRKLNIRELFTQAKNNETEPKSRWFLSAIGLVLLLSGYAISLMTKDPISGILNLLIAVVLVMMGTYALFTSLSILVLKAMKKRKKYYYKPSNFLSTSGMLYRMKSNALSLASISILCTGLMITLGSTVSVHYSMDNKVEGLFSEDYRIEGIESEESVRAILDAVEERIGLASAQVQKKFFSPAVYKEHSFQELGEQNDKDISIKDICYLTVEPLSSYNTRQESPVILGKNEVLIGNNVPRFDYGKPFGLLGESFRATKIDSEKELFRFAIDGFYIVADDEVAERMRDEFPISDNGGNKTKPAFSYKLELSLSDRSEKSKQLFQSIVLDEFQMNYDTPEELKHSYYSINGGFLSLGILLSIVMLIGTSIMLYYKQISEGFSDKERFSIMKQVGLEDALIQKSIQKQILWIFFLPILVAMIHTAFAFNLLSQMLGLFGMRNIAELIKIFSAVSLACLLIYGLFYKITSKVYYRQVK